MSTTIEKKRMMVCGWEDQKKTQRTNTSEKVAKNTEGGGEVAGRLRLSFLIV